jgi:hypothetical protein
VDVPPPLENAIPVRIAEMPAMDAVPATTMRPRLVLVGTPRCPARRVPADAPLAARAVVPGRGAAPAPAVLLLARIARSRRTVVLADRGPVTVSSSPASSQRGRGTNAGRMGAVAGAGGAGRAGAGHAGAGGAVAGRADAGAGIRVERGESRVGLPVSAHGRLAPTPPVLTWRAVLTWRESAADRRAAGAGAGAPPPSVRAGCWRAARRRVAESAAGSAPRVAVERRPGSGACRECRPAE